MTKRVKLPDDWKRLVPTSLLFYTLVRQAPPAVVGEGVIELPEDSIRAHVATCNFGEVVHRGSLSYTAQTPGLDYSAEREQPQVGDKVVWTKHAGTPLTFLIDLTKPASASNLLQLFVLTDTDILVKLTEEQYDHIRSWVR